MPKFKKPKRLKMNKCSEIALDKSIEHWCRVRDENEEAGARGCPLCQIYMFGGKDCNCKYCPVYIKTNKTACETTPYDTYDDYINESKIVVASERKRLAQAEIDFLQTCYY